MTSDDYGSGGLAEAGKRFNAMHEQMFTFALETGPERILAATFEAPA